MVRHEDVLHVTTAQDTGNEAIKLGNDLSFMRDRIELLAELPGIHGNPEMETLVAITLAFYTNVEERLEQIANDIADGIIAKSKEIVTQQDHSRAYDAVARAERATDEDRNVARDHVRTKRILSMKEAQAERASRNGGSAV